jgi:hypothetical protein
LKEIKPEEFKTENQKFEKIISEIFDVILKADESYKAPNYFRPSRVVIKIGEIRYKMKGMQYMNLLQGLSRAWKYMYAVPRAIEECDNADIKTILEEAWSFQKYESSIDDKIIWDLYIAESNKELRVLEPKLYNDLMIGARNIEAKMLSDNDIELLKEFITKFYKHVIQTWCGAYPGDIIIEDRDPNEEYNFLKLSKDGFPPAPLISKTLNKARIKKQEHNTKLKASIALHEKYLNDLYALEEKEKEKEKEKESPSSSSSSSSVSSSLSSPSRSYPKRKSPLRKTSSPMDIEPEPDHELE